MCNKFSLGSPLDDANLGIGFDPLICSANHSCEPNVNMVFNQPATLLRAIKPIKKGEEIFMKYVDVTNPFRSVFTPFIASPIVLLESEAQSAMALDSSSDRLLLSTAPRNI
jgi:hypothetical protein